MQFSVWVALSLCVFVCAVIWGKTVENAVATAEGKSFVFCYAKFYYINITEWLSSCSFASPFSPPINKRPFRLPARKVNRVPSPATLFVIYVAFLLKVTRFPPKGYIVCKETPLSMTHTISIKLHALQLQNPYPSGGIRLLMLLAGSRTTSEWQACDRGVISFTKKRNGKDCSMGEIYLIFPNQFPRHRCTTISHGSELLRECLPMNRVGV